MARPAAGRPARAGARTKHRSGADAAGGRSLPGLAGAQGQSLLPLVDGQRDGPGSAYSETYFPRLYMNWAALRSIQEERWKFIDAPAPELYDLARDAQELTNLAVGEPARVTALRQAFGVLTGGSEGHVAPGRIDRDTAQKLAALGYIGAAVESPPAGDAGRPDPKAMIGVFNRLRGANAAMDDQEARDREHDGAAEQQLRSTVGESSTNVQRRTSALPSRGVIGRPRRTE